MCYPYRVVCEKTVEVVVRGADHTRRRVVLRRFRSEQEMKELLREALRAGGWTEGDDGRFRRRGADGEEMTFDLEAMEVEARLEAEETLRKSRTLERGAYTEREGGPTAEDVAALAARTQEELTRTLKIDDAEQAARRAALEEALTARLEAGETRRLAELDALLGRVYGAALRRMAESMGEVVSERVSRQGGETELVIELKL
jgi:hypothetical protein